MKWLDSNWKLFELIALVIGIVVWAYTTFATAAYVDQKHEGVLLYLERMESKLDRIDQRVYEMKRK